MKILSVFGTKQEAMHMAPVIRHFQNSRHITSVVCVTNLSRPDIKQILDDFHITPDYDLDAMCANTGPHTTNSTLFPHIDAILAAEQPDHVLVYGDTITANAAAMSAFHQHFPVANMVADIAADKPGQAWLQALNARTVAIISDYLFTPTVAAAAKLALQSVTGKIIVTDNSGPHGQEKAAQHIAAILTGRTTTDVKLSS